MAGDTDRRVGSRQHPYSEQAVRDLRGLLGRAHGDELDRAKFRLSLTRIQPGHEVLRRDLLVARPLGTLHAIEALAPLHPAAVDQPPRILLIPAEGDEVAVPAVLVVEAYDRTVTLDPGQHRPPLVLERCRPD